VLVECLEFGVDLNGIDELKIGSTILTAFNDNGAITYLASLVCGLEERLRSRSGRAEEV
jgi:hypothetical protein